MYIPRLPRPAESPMLSDPEREAAEGAESQEEADDIGEPPQHLQYREGDATNDHLVPGDDGRHVKSRGVATDARNPGYQNSSLSLLL